jgi:hypothetical protein
MWQEPRGSHSSRVSRLIQGVHPCGQRVLPGSLVEWDTVWINLDCEELGAVTPVLKSLRDHGRVLSYSSDIVSMDTRW